jgi:putative DNA-invertase from lambdoid prophage Rac
MLAGMNGCREHAKKGAAQASGPAAAVYVRVSTEQQTGENQLEELRRLAVARGFSAVVYSETESAAKHRPVFERMVADVRAGRVAAVLVWALDRLHRSMVGAIQTVLECDRLGVPVISVREPWLDTAGPVRPLLIAIFGWVAEQERTRLIERTKAGLERARRQGKRLGRPPASPILLHAAAELVAGGVPVARAANEKGVSRSTLRRFMAAHAAPRVRIDGPPEEPRDKEGPQHRSAELRRP